MSIWIDVEYRVVHVQNGLAKASKKLLRLIGRPLLMKSRIPSSRWGHAIQHATAL